MRIRGTGRGWRTLSRFAFIGVIGGGTAACSTDASRLGDPFTNPFSSIAGEPAATGSLPDDTVEPVPAIRTPRVQSEELGAPGAAMSPRVAPAAPRIATTGPVSATVSGMNPDAGRAMTPRAAPVPAPQVKVPFQTLSAPPEKAARTKAADAARRAAEAKAAETRAAEAKLAEAKAAEARAAAESRKVAQRAAESKKAEEVRKAEDARKLAEAEARKRAAAAKAPASAKADEKSMKTAAKIDKIEAKPDPKVDAARETKSKADAARKAEANAKLAQVDAAKAEAAKLAAQEATKKVAEARAAESAAKAAAKETAKQAAEAAKEPEKPATVKVASADPTAGASSVAPEPAQAFRWPAKGRVITGYGSAGNEGINIAMPEGTPVKAAEDGTVAYAGSDVKGYGKLVLVRHSNGYVSAYAHNGELDVRPGEKVKRGQTIAKSGATGNVTSPQLHFEIRKGATPVDPIPHLASN